MGNQISGKSSIMKLISTFLWMEKVLFREDFNENDFSVENFRNIYCAYHKIENYFKKHLTEIAYEGESCDIKYTKDEKLLIKRKSNKHYYLPKIIYIPYERILISTIDNPHFIKSLPNSLLNFLDEYDIAKNNIPKGFDLPINDTTLEYVKFNNTVNILGSDYKVNLMEASSGFKSLAPLYFVS